MNIEIHRGTHQIGGCVTEYEHDGWHLFVDYGEELPGGPKTGDLQVEGLTKGDLSKVTEVLSLVASMDVLSNPRADVIPERGS